MLRPAVLLVIFFIFCGISFSQSVDSDYSFVNENTPEFWNSLRILPVQFLEKEEEKNGNVRLSAIFANSFVVERIDFLLPAEKKNENNPSFFQQNKDWEEEVGRKTFLKKFKKNYWLATYLSGQSNILIAAHQFQNWQNLKSSYASHPSQFRKSVNDIEFWKDIRMKMFYFYEIAEDKAYWIFLQPIDKTEPFSESDHQLVNLTKNWVINKRATANPWQDFRVLEQGTLKIQTNTIYHQQEMESSKPRKVLKFTVIDSKFRLRPLVIEKGYFLKNYQKYFWICFYDVKNMSLVRIVQATEKPIEEKK